MTWEKDLEEPFLSIASSDADRIGVLAGPGTGKTGYGLMRRVARLVAEGTPGDRILLISFTRVAAADLRDKVSELDLAGADLVRATTLHGYCFGLLKRDSVLALTGRTPRILLNHEVDLMLRDIGGDHGNIHERRRMLEAFTAGWARDTDDHPGLAVTAVDREFGRAVIEWLVNHDAMLIGEVVPLAHRYLTTNPAAEELDSFDHLVVDEYQDLNTLEQQLLEVLASRATSLCVAGDDDQSIYSVRYANPEGILSFVGREDVDSYTITACGRSPSNLLEMANSLIEQAPGRSKAALVPIDADRVGRASIVQWDDTDSEFDGIVSAIAGDVASERVAPGQILVLTNWRRLGERIRARLAELEIPVRSYFTEEELAAEQGREAIALLRLVVSDRDRSAVRVLLALEDATGRTTAYQRLLTYCRSESVAPEEVMSAVRPRTTLKVMPSPNSGSQYTPSRSGNIRSTTPSSRSTTALGIDV